MNLSWRPFSDDVKFIPGLAFYFVTLPKDLRQPVISILLSQEKPDREAEDTYRDVIDGAFFSYLPEITEMSTDSDPNHQILRNRAKRHLRRDKLSKAFRIIPMYTVSVDDSPPRLPVTTARFGYKAPKSVPTVLRTLYIRL
jgi:hypothetical protein